MAHVNKKVSNENILVKEEYLSSKCEYNEKNEFILMDLLDNKYENVEHYIASIAHIKESKLTALQKAAIGIYIRKLLYSLGIYDVHIDLFEFTSLLGPSYISGEYIKNGKKLIIFDKSDNEKYRVLNILMTIHHECEHILQYKNMINSNFDSNLLTFCEDDLLSWLLDDNYYYSNYKVLSFEFDAEYNAQKKVCEIINSLDDTHIEAKQFLKEELNNNAYKYASSNLPRLEENDNIIFRKYNDKQIPVFILTEIVLKEELQKEKANRIKDRINKEYPCLGIEYNLEQNGKRRTIKELINLFEQSENENYKKIVWNVMLQRFLEERRFCFVEDEEYMKKHYSINDINEKYIEKIIEDIIKINKLDREDYIKIKEKLENINKNKKINR